MTWTRFSEFNLFKLLLEIATGAAVHRGDLDHKQRETNRRAFRRALRELPPEGEMHSTRRGPDRRDQPC